MLLGYAGSKNITSNNIHSSVSTNTLRFNDFDFDRGHFLIANVFVPCCRDIITGEEVYVCLNTGNS